MKISKLFLSVSLFVVSGNSFAQKLAGRSSKSLKEFSCSSSNQVSKGGSHFASTECTVKSIDGRTLSRPSVDFFLGLVNSRVVLDQRSEAGSTYITVQNLEPSVVERKPSNPQEKPMP